MRRSVDLDANQAGHGTYVMLNRVALSDQAAVAGQDAGGVDHDSISNVQHTKSRLKNCRLVRMRSSRKHARRLQGKWLTLVVVVLPQATTRRGSAKFFHYNFVIFTKPQSQENSVDHQLSMYWRLSPALQQTWRSRYGTLGSGNLVAHAPFWVVHMSYETFFRGLITHRARG